MADGDAIIIFEVEPPGRRLELGGSDLPNRGLEAGGSQRLISTRYPGRSVTSTQVMGTEEDDIRLEGVFSDVLGGAAGHALAQSNRARQLRLGQRLCELQWGETIVCRGYVREFTPSYDRESLIRYTLVFEVSSANEAAQVSPTPFPAVAVSDVLVEVERTEGAIDEAENAARHLLELGLLDVPSTL